MIARLFAAARRPEMDLILGLLGTAAGLSLLARFRGTLLQQINEAKQELAILDQATARKSGYLDELDTALAKQKSRHEAAYPEGRPADPEPAAGE